MTSQPVSTWLAQPAVLVPGAKLLDCPPHEIGRDECLCIAQNYQHVIIHTSTPSLRNDCKVAEAIKAQRPDTKIGLVGAHAAVLPTETLKASPAIDWVGRSDRLHLQGSRRGPTAEGCGRFSHRDAEGKIRHNPERETIANMDSLPWVAAMCTSGIFRSRSTSSVICCTRT